MNKIDENFISKAIDTEFLSNLKEDKKLQENVRNFLEAAARPCDEHSVAKFLSMLKEAKKKSKKTEAAGAAAPQGTTTANIATYPVPIGSVAPWMQQKRKRKKHKK